MLKSIIRLSGLAIITLALVSIVSLIQPMNALDLLHKDQQVISAAEKETSKDTRYSQQVQEGVRYFQQRANEQLPLVKSLLVALKSGNLETAKTAYVNSRPPYEEIEVLAASFSQEDSDIDARPYAFEEGEQSPDFKGFHRIEALLYRDKNIQAAVPYGEELVKSVESLIGQLNTPSNFNAPLNFKGFIALSTEVPAKKISSEEETWSDQSLLIFKYNWIGIYSQYKPFAKLVSTKNPQLAQKVDQTYQACLRTVEPFFKSGQVAATPYSSLNMQQRQKIVAASYEFRDALLEVRKTLGLEETESTTK